MSRRLPLLSAAVALSLLVPTGCSGDDDGDDGSTTSTTVSDDVRLRSLLLATTDLPEVYSTGSGTGEVEGGGCSDEGASEEPEASAGVSYVAADDDNTLYEAIGEYGDGGAEAVIDAIEADPRGCLQTGADSLTFEVEPLDFPKLLDETVAVVAVAHPDDRTLTFHQVFVRKGDTLVILLHGGFAPVAKADTEDLARRAAEKLTR